MSFKIFSKKAVAVIVALIMIFSCITVSLGAFAETSSFCVTAGSPAVPLYVGKAINLNTLSVNFGTGEKFASSYDWVKTSGNTAKVSSNLLIGVSEGITEFTVSDSDVSQTVYVIVNEVGDTDFSIIDIDFNDESTYSQSDWYGFAAASYSSTNLYTSGDKFNKLDTCRKFKEVTASDNVKRTAMYLGSINDLGGTKGALFHSKILENFGDYTIDAKMSHVITNSKTSANNTISAAGIMARVSLKSTAATENTNPLSDTVKSVHFRMRNYGGLMITGYAGKKLQSGNEYLANDIAYSYYNGNISADDLWKTGNKTKVFYPDPYGTAKPTINDIKLSLKGSDIKYSINGNVVLDTQSGDVKSMFIPVNNSEGTTSLNPTTSATSALKNTTFGGNYTEGPSFTHSEYDALYKKNIQATKGSIGFSMNYGGDVYIYSVKVTPQNIVDGFPVITDLSPDYTDGIPVNARYDLSKEDKDVVWDDIKTENYQVSGGIITVFSKPAENNITVYGVKAGKQVALGIEIIDAGKTTSREVTEFSDSKITVKPNLLLPNTYTLSINEGELKHGTLIVKDGDEEILVYNGVPGSDNGNEFKFSAVNPNSITVSAEYLTKEESKATLYNLGSTVRLADGGNKEAIRYLARIPAITKTPANAVLENSITVGGKSVTPLSAGTLLMPTAVLKDKELKFPEDYESGDFSINGCKVQNTVITKLAKATDKYSDAFVTLSGFTKGTSNINPLDAEITAVSYIAYEDESGNKGYIYSNPKSVSYNGVLKKAFPMTAEDTDLSNAITGGINHELDNLDYTTADSYGIGEDIIYGYRVKGAYTLDWKLYKDNPSVNAIEEIGEEKSANDLTPVAQGKTVSGESIFTLITRMKQTGALKLVITVTDSYGNPVKYNGGEIAQITANAGAVSEVNDADITTAKLGDNVSFRTDLQELFITDRATALKTAKGKAELSIPKGVKLSWTSNVKDVLDFGGYKVYLSENSSFKNAKEYVTSENNVTVTNLKLATTYYWKVEAIYQGKSYFSKIESFKTVATAPRNMEVSGLTNVRDLGGWATDDGGTVKQGLLFRCSRLSDDKGTFLITQDGINVMLNDLGIKSEMDLRLGWQTGNMTKSPLGNTVNYYSAPMNADLSHVIEDNKASVIKAFKVLGDEKNYPIIFHCSIGTDRTGAIAFLVNALLGVSVDDLYADYLFSNFGNIGDARDSSVPEKYYNSIIAVEGETFKEKTYNYLVGLGVSSDDLDNVIRIMKQK